jgi:5-methylcytosine-specific restriction endonuclease McrA
VTDLRTFAASMSHPAPAERERRREAKKRYYERYPEKKKLKNQKRAERKRTHKGLVLQQCAICGRQFALGRLRTTCGSPACQATLAGARKRNRDHAKRAAVSDITPAQEAEMRRKARKCRKCGAFMTSKPGRPNSKELDHILPINQGGTHTHGNVRIICRRCNQSRPKDGSDYAGTLTLWAQVPGAVRRRRTMCGKGLHPWVPENIGTWLNGGKIKKFCLACRSDSEEKRGRRKPPRECKCGTLFAAKGDRQFMCDDCIDVAASRAAELHASGLNWDQAAAQVGYTTAEGARYAAKRIGYVSEPRPPLPATVPPPRPPRYCQCGAVLPTTRGHGPVCAACVEARAWRAVEMRNAGHTLRQIAAEFGYTSITSVTNLMKTVVKIESRMGRPSTNFDLHVMPSKSA